ncbi:MAG: putative ABC transporter permease [Clostridia bacterium]|nr:putative ABC transporter permease [Clostridia bacterium]
MNFIEFFLVAAFLFFVGSMLGWCTEVIFRRLFTAKKWINPGFLTGPYLPLYGFGLVGLFGISQIPVNTGSAAWDKVILILIMGVAMTLIEYIAGLIFIKGMKIKLWDYSNRRGNVQGIICPLFSFFWLVVSVVFELVITPYVMEWVIWFVNHIAFAFVVGIFFGVFFVDLGHAINLTAKIRAFAKKHNVVVPIEKLKLSIKEKLEKIEKKKSSFVFPFKSGGTITEALEHFTKTNKPFAATEVDKTTEITEEAAVSNSEEEANKD